MKEPLSIHNDPWECYNNIDQFGQHTLTNIEITTTHMCNMRCAHCAVGHTLTPIDPETINLSDLFAALDRVEHLNTLSITGGEPMFSKKSIKEVVTPILKYCEERNIYTQMNSNLTVPLNRYEAIGEYIDCMHISHNWGTLEEFTTVGFERMDRQPKEDAKARLFYTMIENSRALSEQGMFISAETMLNQSTIPHLEHIHQEVVKDMLCSRHEIHPMYPVDFASALTGINIEQSIAAMHKILDIRDEDIWMLFGTLPILPCNQDESSKRLLERLRTAPNVTVRNDPDGRNRLNINVFTGEVIITDFGDHEGTLNTIYNQSLNDTFNDWIKSDKARALNCHCPAVKCVGPNILVKDMYYQDIDFKKREQMMHTLNT